MGSITKPQPVMLFIGILGSEVSLIHQVTEALRQGFGAVFHQTEDLPWAYTGYYAEELGPGIFRRFVFFEPLISPDRLAGIKVETNRIEERYARMEKGTLLRRVNLDPGYLAASKVVLASTKNYSHRIYLAQGIYAEVTLMFVRGAFRVQEHTYPDYRAPETLEMFGRMRQALLDRRRDGKASA